MTTRRYLVGMYRPAAFDIEELHEMLDMVDQAAFGHLVTTGRDGLASTSLPFLVDHAAGSSGRLRGHVARANPHWRTIDGATTLVIFPLADTYVSPSWYPSKAEHGKVVPTWNYAMVQARGIVRVQDVKDWIRGQVGELTQTHERDSERPWAVEDAPRPYMEAQMSAIVGIEIELSALKGKFKLSQNRPDEDRRGVEAALAKDADQAEALEMMNRLKEPGA